MARREFANLPTTPRETGTVVVKTTGGALADISLTVDGEAIAGSTLAVTADGIIPTFYGPPDGADSVVVTMREHGLDWDAAVFASDAPPTPPSGGSLPEPTVEDALSSVRVNTDGDAYELASPGAILTSAGVPLIRCQLQVDGQNYAERRVPYYGRLNDAGDDYIGFKESLSAVVTVTEGLQLDVLMTQLGSTITDLTPEQVTTMGAEGALTTESSTVRITRLDTPGFVRLTLDAAVTPVGGGLVFAGKSGETGTSGVTLTTGAATLAAGTYAVSAVCSIDVFWG